MLIAGGESLTCGEARTGIDPRLEALAVDVVHETFHVRKLLVREDLPVRIAPRGGVVGSVRALVPAGLPRVVDVDVRVALRGEAAADHAIRGSAHMIRRHVP